MSVDIERTTIYDQKHEVNDEMREIGMVPTRTIIVAGDDGFVNVENSHFYPGGGTITHEIGLYPEMVEAIVKWWAQR